MSRPAARLSILICPIVYGLRLGWADDALEEVFGQPGMKRTPKNLYLRIQKTGSTSFASALSTLFREHGLSIATDAHYDWKSGENRRLKPDHIFTLLRDPVERFLSEMLYIAWRPRIMLSQNMWDFAGRRDSGERQQVRETLGHGTHNEMLTKFMKLTVPTRNRQMLYVLGFERIPCNSGDNAGFCHDPSSTAPLPSHAYDWDNKENELLLLAQEHLRAIHFGITECMSESVRGIASDMGWDADRAEELVRWVKKSGLGTRPDLQEEETMTKDGGESLRRVHGVLANEPSTHEAESQDFLDDLDFDPLVDSSMSDIDEHVLKMLAAQHPSHGEQKEFHRVHVGERPKTYAELFSPHRIFKLRKHLSAEIRFYNFALDLFKQHHPAEQCDAKPSEEA